MDTAKMSQGSDSSNSSDDLIAELARLMAADARGDAPDASADGARQSSPADVPAQKVETPVQAPSERLDANYDADKLFNSADAQDMRPAESSGPRFAPTFKGPTTRTRLMHDDEVRDEVERSPTPPRREPIDLFAGVRKREQPAHEVVHTDTSIDDLMAGVSAEANEPQDKSNADPIGRLIAEKLGGADLSASAPRDPGVALGDDDDSFGISPVFGVSSGQQAEPRSETAQQQTERRDGDPLEDIESLIGRAVRAERPSTQPDRWNAPQTADAPREPDVSGAAEAAEAAILAATAAVGDGQRKYRDAPRQEPDLDMGQAPVDSALDAELDERADTQSRKRSSNRKRFVGPLLATALLASVAGGLYWAFGSQPEEGGAVPVLSAEAVPAKVTPEAAESDATNATESVVFSGLDGESGPGNTEQLVSRDQSEAVDTADVSRVITQNTDQAGLVNRKVRTVTVRPDGTIVSGDESIAGGEVLPVVRPEVPTLPAGTATAASEFANVPITSTPATTEVASAESTALPNIGAATTEINSALVAPIPRPRPVNRAALAAPVTSVPATTTPTTNTTPAATVAPSNGAVDLLGGGTTTQTPQTTVASTQTASASTGTAYVQLSSQRTEAAARQTIADMQSRFSSSLNGGTLEVQSVDLGERGIFYRVRLPADSLQTANTVCSNIKLQGGDCFVRNN